MHKVCTDSELFALWPNVRKGLLRVARKTEGVFWRPEDYYHEIKSGRADLLAITLDSRYVGFIITKFDSHPDGRCLHVWAAYHQGDDPGFVEDLFGLIKDLKQALGCVRLSLSSSRKGWVRIAKKYGYRPTDTLYYFSD
jgi:hypothetical protein